MAFCTNCGVKAVGSFCTNCGQAISVGHDSSVFQTGNQSSQLPPTDSFRSYTPEHVADAAYASKTKKRSLRDLATEKKPLFFGLITLGLLGVFFLFPSAGSFKVKFIDSSSTNAPTGFEITTNGTSKSFAGVNYDGQILTEGTWSVFQPISITYTPAPLKDEIVALRVPFFATLGIWNLGRELTAVVEVDNQSSKIRLDGQVLAISNFESVGFRSNYKLELELCKSQFVDTYGNQINYLSNAEESYLRFVKQESLDGYRTLYYTIWAARSDNLQDRMMNFLFLLNPQFPDSKLSAAGSDVVSAFDSVRSAWGNLESVARAEAESRWDAAWDRIYDAQSNLASATSAFITESGAAAQRDCTSQLER